METFKKTYGVPSDGASPPAGTQKKTYEPKFKSGAQKGLEAKMSYWTDRDYQYEFGVTVGMSMNIAAQLGEDMDISTTAKRIFKLALDLKLDPEMIAMFDEYYGKKKRLGA